jgi:hypothetical protein
MAPPNLGRGIPGRVPVRGVAAPALVLALPTAVQQIRNWAAVGQWWSRGRDHAAMLGDGGTIAAEGS